MLRGWPVRSLGTEDGLEKGPLGLSLLNGRIRESTGHDLVPDSGIFADSRKAVRLAS